MGIKMGNKMVTLCSAAIGMIYIAGYIVTEPSGSELAQNETAVTASIQNQQVIEKNPNPLSGANNGKYRDGTYYGQGTNRFGTVEVAVTIKQDKITSVQITNCTTHYAQSYIDDLPDQVVERQDGNVDVVSGATRSTDDFQTAVNQALLKAERSSTSS